MHLCIRSSTAPRVSFDYTTKRHESTGVVLPINLICISCSGQRATMKSSSRTAVFLSTICLAICFIVWKIYLPSPTSKGLFQGRLTNPFSNSWTADGEERFTKRFQYLETIWHDCGELCNTSRGGIGGAYFNQTKANIQCDRLFRNEDIDRGHAERDALQDIPEELWKEFTMNGRLQVRKMYFNQTYLGGKARQSIWTIEDIERNIEAAKKGELRGNYGKSETNALRDGLRHAPNVVNGRVLVIGSEKPWVEACVLEAGAREVVTLEYGEIVSEHPKIRTMVPSEFRQKYLNGALGTFDGIVTFSSVEHSGLGRYGDALNPWGDIITIARAWCVTRDGGSLTIGVMYQGGKDYIAFNAHRVYGKLRYPYLTTNWHQYYEGQGSQRVYVFTK